MLLKRIKTLTVNLKTNIENLSKLVLMFNQYKNRF